MSKALGEQWQNEDGSTDCFTCGKVIPPGGKVDRGHFLPKRIYTAHYFNADTIRAQCFKCNAPGQGEQLSFYWGLRKEIGDGKMLEIWWGRNDGWSEDRQWYIQEIRKWQQLTK